MNKEIEYSPTVELIREMGFLRSPASVSASVRRDLSAAVKKGYLGKLKKDGHKPEVLYHPDFLQAALDFQKEEETKIKIILASVLA